MKPGSPPRGRGKAQQGFQRIRNGRITPAWAGKSDDRITSVSDFKDHPRVGGEKFLDHWCVSSQMGSPPRGRGKAKALNGAISAARITPAWAGKSKNAVEGTGFHGDHPRVGGEKSAITIWPFNCWGSPPRGRGKGDGVGTTFSETRITPAWAGKSQRFGPPGPSGRDHPRVGGEKSILPSFPYAGIGSPPRGRGKALSW